MCSMNEHNIKEDLFHVLRVLSSNESFSQRDLSSRLGFSLGKTNYLLKALGRKNLIKIKNFSSRENKLNKVRYILTKKGLEEKVTLTYYFLRRKEEEYRQLKKDLETFAQQREDILRT
ncbi:MAG: MarR family EPS-associated transcriptional regulator [Candidatus Omnitrophica bacterium]|nr:MarR family EPS-associated transcriptional regulator [Candidatus Omnitrophota bacterium]